MRAALLATIPASGLDVTDVPEPTPGPDELLIAVSACGICGTDLHILRGESYRPGLPFILGHEPVGVVIAAGSPRNEARLGQRVVPQLFVGDRTCPYCLAGDDRLCPHLVGITGVMGFSGGFAERMTLRVDQAIAVPDAVSDEQAACLVDAGATAANAVRVTRQLLARLPQGGQDGHIVIVGAGPIGLLVAELLARVGLRYVLVQRSEARRAVARTLGHPVVATLEHLDVLATAVIDCAGAASAASWAIDHLAPRGCFVAAGYTAMPPFEGASMARKELILTGVRSGDARDLQSMLDLVADGAIRLPPIRSYPLDEVNQALDDLRDGTVPGKAIVTLQGIEG